MKTPARSRREFMRLLAAGSAAALAAPAAVLAAETAKQPQGSEPAAAKAPAPISRQRRARTGEAAARPALPAEIEKQKKYLADSLKRIRDYSLPPGSTPSFVFRPLAASRGKRVAR